MLRAVLIVFLGLALAGCDGIPANEIDPEHRDEDRGGDY